MDMRGARFGRRAKSVAAILGGFVLAASCTTFSYRLTVNNNTELPCTIVIEPAAFDEADSNSSDGRRIELAPYSTMQTYSRTFMFVSYSRDIELRTILVYDADGKYVETDRLSSEYLRSKDYIVEFPLSRLDFNVSRRYAGKDKELNFAKSLQPYVRAQYFYNKGDYADCAALVDGLTDEALRAEIAESIGGKVGEKWVSDYWRGYCLLGLLSHYKLGDRDGARVWLDRLEKEFGPYHDHLVAKDEETMYIAAVLRGK